MDRPLFRGNPVQSVAAGEACQLDHLLNRSITNHSGMIALNTVAGAAIIAHLVIRFIPASIRELLESSAT